MEDRDRKRLLFITTMVVIVGIVLIGRLYYLMIIRYDFYNEKATRLHEREREIKGRRGAIYDRNNKLLAGNQSVCTISVIHNQIKDEKAVIRTLSENLDIDISTISDKVKKHSMREIIAKNISKDIALRIKEKHIAGIIIDEDYKRIYPNGSTASKVIGFTGADNQGILGLEVYYDDTLMGKLGSINAVTDARGINIENVPETRIDAKPGNNLVTTLDLNIQKYCEELALRTMELRRAKRVSIVVMNPNNGEILAMVNVPEYDLNDPFTLVDSKEMTEYLEKEDGKNIQDLRNKMWRNFCINDTYEPGSTFKIITATMAFEKGVLSVTDRFYCAGYKRVSDRKIRCSKVKGHGSQSFKEGIMNSCNPVFIEVGQRVGVKSFYEYYDKLGLNDKTGIDIPGEGRSIIHKQENVGPVELATMSFGQSFQITPMELLRAISAVINGGTLVTPHFGKYITDEYGNIVDILSYKEKTGVVSKETSDKMKSLLFAVVDEGTGKKAKIEGLSIGGKTATSEKLPRRSGKYIASFVGFAPAENPSIIAMVLIDEPKGLYYGGTIAAPVIKELFENIL